MQLLLNASTSQWHLEKNNMAIASTYDIEEQSDFNPEDIVIGTSIDPLDNTNNATRNFSLGIFVSYLTNGSTGVALTAPDGIPEVSTLQRGLMGVDDKAKLNRITVLETTDLDDFRSSTQVTTEITNAIGAIVPEVATDSTTGVVRPGTGLTVTAAGILNGVALETGNGNASTALPSNGQADTALVADGVNVIDRTITTQAACTAAGGTFSGGECTRRLVMELIALGGTPSGNGFITFENEV